MGGTMKCSFIAMSMLLALLAGTAHAQTASLILQWHAQAQFAGYFVALDKGFYAKRGIDLTLMEGGPDIIASETLESRRTMFATMFLSTAIQRRAAGIPIVNIAQFAHHSGMMLIAKKSSKISKIYDLYNRKIGLWANEFQLQPRTLFHRKKLNVKVIPMGSSLDLFLRGGVDVASGMNYNEYHRIYEYGIDFDELNTFRFSQLGMDFPEDGLYTLQETLDRNPELCRKMVEATKEGWLYAFAHKNEALAIVKKHMTQVHLPFARSHQRWMLNAMETLFEQNASDINTKLDEKAYMATSQALLEAGFIRRIPHYEDFRTEVRQ